jgi:hypothetical protein
MGSWSSWAAPRLLCLEGFQDLQRSSPWNQGQVLSSKSAPLVWSHLGPLGLQGRQTHHEGMGMGTAGLEAGSQTPHPGLKEARICSCASRSGLCWDLPLREVTPKKKE